MDTPKITLKERRRIYKYTEGADPEIDEPYEVLEKEYTYKDEEAERVLRSRGIDPEKVRAQFGRGNEHAVNKRR